MLAYQLQKISVNRRWNFVPLFSRTVRPLQRVGAYSQEIGSKSQDVIAAS
jgi:hypothetical protein